MAKEEEVLKIMEALVVATDRDVGEVMAARGHWAAGQSARVNSVKILKKLSELGNIERCDGFWRLRGSKSEHGAHSRMLTKALVELLKLDGMEAVEIYREHYAPNDRRADALVLLKKAGKGFCFLLEVVHEEKEEYLKGKIRSWREWEDATEYLANLFKVNIPYFEVIVQREGGSICQQLPSLE